jgi:flavorubredoxin
MWIEGCINAGEVKLVKVSVFYDSKYGNTRMVAEKIVEGLQNKGIEADLANVKDIQISSAICSDVIVLGAPNHMAAPSRAMKRFIAYLATADLKATHYAVFGTYSGRARPVDRSAKKLDAMVHAKMPALKQVLPPLSVRVNGVSGPVMDGELSRCVEFAEKLAGQLKKLGFC